MASRYGAAARDSRRSSGALLDYGGRLPFPVSADGQRFKEELVRPLAGMGRSGPIERIRTGSRARHSFMRCGQEMRRAFAPTMRMPSASSSLTCAASGIGEVGTAGEAGGGGVKREAAE